MSIGQIAEIATMAYLGFFLKRLGWRTTMIIGVLGHVVRFGIYSLAAKIPSLFWLVILSNIVHGFAYAFFFATVYIFVDENFPQRRTNERPESVQPADPGTGPSDRQYALGKARRQPHGPVDQGSRFFYAVFYPLGIGLFATAIMTIFFHPQAKDPVPEEVPVLVN